jgi:hypothetical protein
MVDFTGKEKNGDLVLTGKCAKCGHKSCGCWKRLDGRGIAHNDSEPIRSSITAAPCNRVIEQDTFE